MSASLGQQGASPNNTQLLSGGALIQAFAQCPALRNDGVTRAWTEGHQFDNSIAPPDKLQKRGVHYSPAKLANLGLWGHKESDQIAADITTLVECVCSSWDAFKAIYDKENRQDQNALVEAIAQNVYDLWGANPGWSSHHQETYKDAVKRMVKYSITFKPKSRSATPHVTKQKPPKNKGKTTQTPAQETQRKPKQEECESVASPALKKDIIESPYKRVKINPVINKLEMKDMALFVSRDVNWDGDSMPPINNFRELQFIETNDVEKATDCIPKWLRSEAVQWDPYEEDVIILNSGPFHGTSVGFDFHTFSAAFLHAYRNLERSLRLKIVPKKGNDFDMEYDPDLILTPPWVSEEEEEEEEEAKERDEEEINDGEEQTMNFEEVMNRTSPILAKFTFEEWCNARKFFGMPPLLKMINKKEKVKWIKKPLYPHQYMMIYQATRILEERGAMFLADEQGLGKTIMTISLMWLKNVLVHMTRSINRFRNNNENAKKHLPEDASTGQECPSQGYFPFKCICNPDSPARNWVIDMRPSLVVCMVKSTIPDWAGTVNDFCDEDCPFQLKSVIGHGTIKSKTGPTRRTKNSTKDDAVFDSRILSFHEDGTSCELPPPVNYVVITTPSSALAWVVNAIGDKEKRTSAAFSLIAVDEFHQITGDSTAIIRTLEKFTCKHQSSYVEGERPPFSQAKGVPTKFVFSSGTPWKDLKDLNVWCSLAKTQMTPMLKFVKRACPKDVLKRIRDEVNRFCKCDFLLEHNKATKLWNDNCHDKAKETTTSVVHAISPIMLRRMQLTHLPDSNGKTSIVPLPEFEKRNVQVNYSDQELEHANAQIQMLKDAFKVHANSKSKGPATFQNLQTTFIREYHTSQVVATAPSLATLIRAGDFNDWLYNSPKEKGKNPNATIKLTQARMDCQRYRKDNSALRRKVTKTTKDDPKMVKIIEIIRNIMAHDDGDRNAAQKLKDQDPTSFIGTPDDYLQKIVVTAQQPMSAVVIHDVLQSALPDVGITLFLATMNDKDKEIIISSFNDTTVVDDKKTAQNADGKEVMMFMHKNRPRILVGVQRVLSTGLNLQRGNHIILAEPSNNPSEVLQMEKRCHRLGQQRKCYVYDLIAKNVRIEEVIRDKREMRVFLQTVAEQVGIEVE
ncbi:hypothetical protein J3E72DRAFT_433177 [Bipolaris maydis]|nr:hypothetical protein J3E74DRAFT_420717 [Bipolaris maydis]KAJ6195164.1 hypothetical protein J3E72DRAFT_433177 [Bipolaris maydis]KAJ6278519.1 hypothetical protein J3E71DRAFT_223038 [Bipolaris maydis]